MLLGCKNQIKAYRLDFFHQFCILCKVILCILSKAILAYVMLQQIATNFILWDKLLEMHHLVFKGVLFQCQNEITIENQQLIDN